MKRSDRARLASWMQVPCPVCAAVPGQRCRIAPGAFQAVFHVERTSSLLPRKPVQHVGVPSIAERRIA